MDSRSPLDEHKAEVNEVNNQLAKIFKIIEEFNNKINGSTILDPTQKGILLKWYPGNWRLLYKASRDGFSASQFHSKCDDKGPTIVVVRCTRGYIFGGYTQTSWSSVTGYIRSRSSLFTLRNQHNYPPTMLPVNTAMSDAIYCSSTCGPTFGGGHDLHICDNSNARNNSYVRTKSYPPVSNGIKPTSFVRSTNF